MRLCKKLFTAVKTGVLDIGCGNRYVLVHQLYSEEDVAGKGRTVDVA